MSKRTFLRDLCLAVSLAALLAACASVAPHAGHRLRTPPPALPAAVSTLNGPDPANRAWPTPCAAAGPYTVFAPSNEAFKAVPAATMKPSWRADKELLRSVLTYHVVPGKVAAAEVKNGNVKTVQGANVALARAGGFVTVEDAMVTQADVNATNGVVHVIDRVLLPPRR